MNDNRSVFILIYKVRGLNMKNLSPMLNLFKSVAIMILVVLAVTFPGSSAECKMPGSVTLEGVITDGASAESVSGAAVSAGEKAVKSDENGRYSISGLMPGRIIVEIKKPGYETYSESIKVTKGSNSFNIKLKAQSSPSGAGLITEDRGGLAVKNSYEDLVQKSKERRQNYRRGSVSEKVAAADYKGANYIAGKVIDMASGVPISRAKIDIDGDVYFSDAAGEFISAPVKKAQCMIKADSPNYNAYESNIKITTGKNKLKILLMPLPENSMAYTGYDKGKIVEYSKFSQRYASVSGHVRDARTKNPVNNATVIVANKSVQTNPEGFYMVEGLAMGHADITIIAGSYGVYKGNLNLVKVSNLNDVALSMDERFGIISGTVVEKETGRPIHGAKIQVGNKIVVSDQYGSFTIKDVAYDYYNLIVEQKGYQRIEKALSVNQESITATVELADEYQSVK